MKESLFRKWVLASFAKSGMWVERYEPRRGGGTGIPDIQIAVGNRLIPIELKVGEVKEDRLYIDEIRPDQIGWHKRISIVKVFSFFLIGMGRPSASAPERAFAIGLPEIIDWKNGIPIRDTAEISVTRFRDGLLTYIHEKAAST